MNEDGSVILVGNTFGDWSRTNADGRDCVVIKLDADGIMQWTWQVKLFHPSSPGINA